MEMVSISPNNKGALVQRFLASVRALPGDGCWLWQGYIRPNGYGTSHLARRVVYAHRLAWRLEYGPVPDGMQVCHHCDNRRCVRPDHLFVGPATLNSLDMHQKGRRMLPQGERHGRARLTADDVRAIRAACDAGERQADLAAQYGVTTMTISNIHCRVSWRHI